MFGDRGDLTFVLFHTCYMFIYPVSKGSTSFTNVLFTTQGAFNQIYQTILLISHVCNNGLGKFIHLCVLPVWWLLKCSILYSNGH